MFRRSLCVGRSHLKRTRLNSTVNGIHQVVYGLKLGLKDKNPDSLRKRITKLYIFGTRRSLGDYNAVLQLCSKNPRLPKEIFYVASRFGIPLSSESTCVRITRPASDYFNGLLLRLLAEEKDFSTLLRLVGLGLAPHSLMLLNSLMKVCKRFNIPTTALKLVDEFVSNGLVLEVRVYTSLAGVCISGGRAETGVNVLEMIAEGRHCQDTVSQFALVGAYRSVGLAGIANFYLERAVSSRKFKPRSLYNQSVVNASSLVHERGVHLIPALIEDGVPTTANRTADIRIAVRDRKWDIAQEIFEEMSNSTSFQPNVVTYTFMLLAAKGQRDISMGLHILETMASKGIAPDCATYTTALTVAKVTMRYSIGFCLFHELQRSYKTSLKAYSAAINLCAAARNSQQAFAFFDEMLIAGIKPDARLYSSLIASCKFPSGKLEDGLMLFQRMKDEGIAPISPTYDNLISVCETHDNPTQAYAIFREAGQKGVAIDTRYSYLAGGGIVNQAKTE